MIRQLFISALLLILLTQCGKRVYRYKWENPSFQPLRSLSQTHTSSIPGNWTNATTIFSISDLVINENGTFSYYFGGCTGRSYTEGTWTSIGNTFILTSYDKYKPEKVVEPVIILVQENDDKTGQANAKQDSTASKISDSINSGSFSKLDFSKVYLETTYVDNINFDSFDSGKYYLDHVMYRLVGDTLYELDNTTQLCNQSRFWRPREYLPLKTFNEYLYPDAN